MFSYSRRGFYSLVILVIVVIIMGGYSSEVKADTSIFINEIHYDNTGADVGEAIEIAGPAGTDLSGWDLVLYNGNGGASYQTTALSGTITDQDNGYGVLSFSISGIQNGSPDGIALVDDSSSVVQFLSYEGSFTATNGPANGMISTDIGVSEPSSTAVGYSLQLTGTGNAASDFSWASAAANTFGAVNTGQTFLTPTPNIIINEVDADQDSTDTAEFVELYSGSGNVDLTGMVLVFYNGSDDASYEAFDLDGQSTDANGYFVLCGDASNVANCDMDVSPNTNLVQNGADAIALYTGDATDFPNDTPVTTTDLLDAIVYDTNESDDAGLLVLLNASEPQVNEDGGSDSTIDSNQRCPNGSGGARNTSTYAQYEPTPGEENTCGATPPDVLINEVDADQDSTDTAEFVELYSGSGNVDLTGMVLVFYNGSDDASYEAFDLDGQSTDANGYFVLCGDASNVANCDMDVSPNTNLVQNGADAIALYTGDATDFPNDTPVTTTDLLDAIVYDTNESDDAGLLVLLNASEPQVNEDGGSDSTTDSNQRCPNGSGGARNTSTYAQYEPTPGEENTCGATPPDVLINEVDADQDSTDTAEFVELYSGSGNVDLTGMVLVFYNGSDDASYEAFDLDGQSTDANGYFVLCGDASNVANCDMDVSPNTNLVQNGADAIALYTGDATDFPNDTPVTTTDLLDAIVYDTNESDDAGLLVLLNASEPQVNEDGGSDSTTDSNQRCPNGSGGARNTNTYAQFAPTPGDFNSCANIDLELAKTVDNNNPDEGDTITFTLTISNVSTDQSATNVVVRDYLPDTTTEIENLVLGTCSSGSITTIAANTLEWSVGTLGIGGSATCDISVDIRTGTDGTTLNNYAEVYSVTETTDSDSTPGNFSGTPSEDDEAGIQVNVGLPAACGTSATLISTIQGSGSASPEDGNIHTIEGVVVGDFQTSNNLSGFFVQEEDTDVDGNPATSEGILVFDGASPAVDVAVGDLVRVTGTVDEYYDMTELTSITNVLPCGTGTATEATITLPVASLDIWEQHEGMLVSIPQTLYATGNYNQGRYGEVELSIDSRLDNPTNVVDPGVPANTLQELNDRSRIQLEDGRTSQNPDPAPYMGTGNTLRAGDTLPSLTGVLNYAYGDYEIHPTGTVTFTRVNTRSATPPSVGGTIKVASFNVLNYFTTIDDSGPICGPSSNMDCRGADTAAEFTRQRDKIIAAIVAMDADVIGLMELENHPSDDALQDLINGLNALVGPGTYASINTGTIGTDAIKVAFIYKTATVTPEGAHAILDSSVDPTFIDTKNRPTLAQTFSEIASGEKFTVAVNHFKSKGSSCDSIGDPDTGDGQGNCNQTRTSAANAVVNWLTTDPTSSGDTDFLIIGDLNAYAKEDPVTAITDAGYVNLVDALIADAYSYVYYGQRGYLDHALGSPSLVTQVSGVTEWHINADEPSALDYNDYNQAALYNADAYRASDHDPVIVGLNFDTDVVVTNTNDSGTGSLRQAIADVGIGGTITFDLSSYPAVIALTSGELSISKDMTITGPDARELTISGNDSSRVFNISNGTVNISDLVVADGNTNDNGAGFYVSGGAEATLENCHVKDNTTTGSGDGGGIYVTTDSTVTIRKSAISGNTSAQLGGGIISAGNLNLYHATISQNMASGNGGALIVEGTGTSNVVHCTITDNTSGGSGTGAVANFAVMDISNSVIANNMGGDGNCDTDQQPASGGYNIVGDSSCSFSSAGDQNSTDPLLGVLQNNGGTTPTHALGVTSPAIDTISSGVNGCGSTHTADQRGATRPTDGDEDSTSACDSGALELGGVQCGIQAAGPATYTFLGDIFLEVTNTGSNLDCFRVTDIPWNHPNAASDGSGQGTETGKYWVINGLLSDKSTQAATDYTLKLTLPHTLGASHDSAKVCKYPGSQGGSGWDCFRTGSDASTVWLEGITSLSDWTVGDDVGPTAITLQGFTARTGPSSAIALLFGLGVLGVVFVWTKRRS